MGTSTPLVTVIDLTKIYRSDDGPRVAALDGVTLSIERGEFVAVMGPSGSGKSTFMNIVGLLDEPTSGRYWLEGRDVSRLSANERADLRCRSLGFIFQAYNLLPRTSAMENVELPMLYAGVGSRERHRAAQEALDAMGVGDQAMHLPSQLSGGEQQRVAIARALVNTPTLILADEPTGALDTKNSSDVMLRFQRLNEDRGLTVLLVTHDPHMASYAKRIVTFRDGRVISDAATVAQSVL